MTSAPRVTLCVPTIGRVDYLDRLLGSVSAQTFRDVEVLVLDNASPPEVARTKLEPWVERDPRARILRCEPRIPMFRNFNRGIAAARGTYVVFFHDDDDYAPGLVARMVEILDAHPRASFAGSNYDFIDERDRVTERRRWIRATRVVPGRAYMEDLVSRARNIVPMPGLVFRRSSLGAGFDERLPIHFGDFTLLMRLAEGHEVALLAEPLVRIRRHAEQASVSMPLSRSIPLRTRVLLDYLDEYEVRYPRDRGLALRLRRRVRLGHRTGLVWGWLSASDSGEARACTDALRPNGPGAAYALDALDRAGLRARLGSEPMRRAARRVAPALRL